MGGGGIEEKQTLFGSLSTKKAMAQGGLLEWLVELVNAKKHPYMNIIYDGYTIFCIQKTFICTSTTKYNVMLHHELRDW